MMSGSSFCCSLCIWTSFLSSINSVSWVLVTISGSFIAALLIISVLGDGCFISPFFFWFLDILFVCKPLILLLIFIFFLFLYSVISSFTPSLSFFGIDAIDLLSLSSSIGFVLVWVVFRFSFMLPLILSLLLLASSFSSNGLFSYETAASLGFFLTLMISRSVSGFFVKTVSSLFLTFVFLKVFSFVFSSGFSNFISYSSFGVSSNVWLFWLPFVSSWLLSLFFNSGLSSFSVSMFAIFINIVSLLLSLFSFNLILILIDFCICSNVSNS